MEPGTSADWPTDKLNALRLGRRLVTEVHAEAGRRTFVDITPTTDGADSIAVAEGSRRSSPTRSFTVEQWDYDATSVDGWDYDIGARLVRAATAVDEADLVAVLAAWGLLPRDFAYLWDTADPR